MNNDWNRKLWGVQLTVSDKSTRLIGQSWDHIHVCRHDGEPPRAMLFETRRQARMWCKAKHAQYADRPVYDLCREWRFRAVRVVETVTIAKSKSV